MIIEILQTLQVCQRVTLERELRVRESCTSWQCKVVRAWWNTSAWVSLPASSLSHNTHLQTQQCLLHRHLMEDSGDGWLSLPASWGTSSGTVWCTGDNRWLRVNSKHFTGLPLSFGVFLPELKKHFNAGSGEVSTIISIQMGVTFGSGWYLFVIKVELSQV